MKLDVRLSPVLVVLMTTAVCSVVVAQDAATDGKHFTQAAEIAAAQTVDGQSVSEAQPQGKATDLLQTGPKPVWIWGDKPDTRYFLKQEFPGARSGVLTATCDNVMTVWLNGKQIAQSDEWQSPVRVALNKHLSADKNELLVEVSNQGGAAAFILKAAFTKADGTVGHVVSDTSWKAATAKDSPDWVAAKLISEYGKGPWNEVLDSAGSANSLRNVFQVLPGFQVERLFTVPKETLGSWVCIAFDPQGRLIASDQGDKGLCRITPAPIGSNEPTKIEHLDVKITAAQGMLFAFDSLYLSVNGGPGSGLYRLRDTNGDDQYDEVKKLASIRGGGEHGPHALRLAPNGKSIFVLCGNHTDPPEHIDSSWIPTNWNEDQLLPRQWDANGHAVGRLAPGGWVARTDPEGKSWDIFSIGYRNPYDMDFNADGELFVYDADMEWDMGSPWYRPTRVTHTTAGSEFGWRSGTGKWPAYYPDSLPQLVDIGPGSPVGVTFGYGTKFPSKYQQALYVLDWTFSTIYAVHPTPAGASYTATKEEFLSRTPLPLTDAAVGPDGALYFTVGGRGTQSELFRVTYVGSESTKPVEAASAKDAELRALRHKLENISRQSPGNADNIDFLWRHLGHADRHIRYAARVSLEFQPAAQWQARFFAEKNAQTLITAAIALAHQGEKSLETQIAETLLTIDLEKLTETQKIELMRAWQLVFIRLGEPLPETAARVAAVLNPLYPSPSDPLNRELCSLLVYLKSPQVIEKSLALLQRPRRLPSVELSAVLSRNAGYGGSVAQMIKNHPDIEQIHIALALRNMKQGWTIDQRKTYFQWFTEARKWSGGASYQGFLRNIDRDAFENASESERLAVEALGARVPYKAPELPMPAGPGEDWTMGKLLPLSETKMKGRNFENGKKMFAATRCIICHRFAGDGGATGPDLTQSAGRFGFKDMAEAIVDPSKVVSDQYRALVVSTAQGKNHTGRLVDETSESLTLVTDPEDPTKVVKIDKKDIDERTLSATSLMPKDLLKPLNQDEVLDLLAYLLSRGNPQDAMFKK